MLPKQVHPLSISASFNYIHKIVNSPQRSRPVYSTFSINLIDISTCNFHMYSKLNMFKLKSSPVCPPDLSQATFPMLPIIVNVTTTYPTPYLQQLLLPNTQLITRAH